MKKIISLCFVLMSLGSYAQLTEEWGLTFPENGKMVYALSDGEPITGVIYAVHEDGSLFKALK